MQETRIIRIWKIFYPIAIYFIGANTLMFLLGMFIENRNENYMILQTFSTMLTIPILYQIYRMDQIYYHPVWNFALWKEKLREKGTGKRIFLIVITSVFASMALNNLIYMTGLVENSASYQQVSKAFFGSGIIWEVAGTCVAAPILEELLYRGILYQRMKTWYGKGIALLGSAFLFGIMHMNLVQFIYAFILGILLAVYLEKAGHLYGAILGHMAANLAAVIRTETGCLHWMEQNQIVFVLGTIIMMAVALFYCKKLWKV